MRDTDATEQFRLLQQEVTFIGEVVEGLRRDQRADVDALRLEVEVLRRCLLVLHPELAEQLTKVRAEVVQDTDPETV